MRNQMPESRLYDCVVPMTPYNDRHTTQHYFKGKQNEYFLPRRSGSYHLRSRLRKRRLVSGTDVKHPTQRGRSNTLTNTRVQYNANHNNRRTDCTVRTGHDCGSYHRTCDSRPLPILVVAIQQTQAVGLTACDAVDTIHAHNNTTRVTK